MSEQIHAEKAGEQVSSESGLLLSAEPLEGGRLSALGDDSSDADRSDRGDSDGGILGGDTGRGGLTDADSSDAGTLTDADASDEGDSDGTDGGDSIESESGLGGENPLGIGRERIRNGDDRDTRDT